MAGSLTPSSITTASATGFAISADRVSVTPTGNVAATDAQSAIAELEAEKAPTGNLALSAAATDIVLTAAQFANNSFDVTGALTASINIILPDGIAHSFIVDNATSGAFTVTVKHSATAGVVVPQGTKQLLYTTGSVVEGVTAATGGGVVTSVFTRTGDVVAASGDYTAAQVTNTPAGSIAAATVQAAINELDGDVTTHTGAANPHSGSAASGANSDITSLSGLTTALSIGQGGTGQTTAQAAIDALSQVSAATNEHVLTKDTATGNAIWKAAGGASVGDHEVTVHTGNGHGSTNTAIRRFTTAIVNTGTSITYADSATLGGSFTIGATGIYAISYSDKRTTAGQFGISVNSSQLTTGVEAINVADRRSLAYINAGFAAQVAWAGKLTSGDVVRAHTDTGANGTDAQTYFTIRRLADV